MSHWSVEVFKHGLGPGISSTARLNDVSHQIGRVIHVQLGQWIDCPDANVAAGRVQQQWPRQIRGVVKAKRAAPNEADCRFENQRPAPVYGLLAPVTATPPLAICQGALEVKLANTNSEAVIVGIVVQDRPDASCLGLRQRR